MANPRLVSPVGFSRNVDVLTAAQQQDRERRIREDDEHFRRTGENREPIEEEEFLVPISSYVPPVIADEIEVEGGVVHTSPLEGYVEDQPSSIIDPSFVRPPRQITSMERIAYLERQHELEEKKMKIVLEKVKKKFNNAITGLEL